MSQGWNPCVCPDTNGEGFFLLPVGGVEYKHGGKSVSDSCQSHPSAGQILSHFLCECSVQLCVTCPQVFFRVQKSDSARHMLEQ